MSEWRDNTVPYIIRREYGACVHSKEGRWCDQHAAHKDPSHPCEAMQVVLNTVDEVLDDLRAKVEALPPVASDGRGDIAIWRSDVLALIDGSSDE